MRRGPTDRVSSAGDATRTWVPRVSSATTEERVKVEGAGEGVERGGCTEARALPATSPTDVKPPDRTLPVTPARGDAETAAAKDAQKEAAGAAEASSVARPVAAASALAPLSKPRRTRAMTTEPGAAAPWNGVVTAPFPAPASRPTYSRAPSEVAAMLATNAERPGMDAFAAAAAAAAASVVTAFASHAAASEETSGGVEESATRRETHRTCPAPPALLVLGVCVALAVAAALRDGVIVEDKVLPALLEGVTLRVDVALGDGSGDALEL